MPRPADLRIQPRTPSFDVAAALNENRYWLGGDPVLTHFFNALQATFPEGERFFIDSARAIRQRLAQEMPPGLDEDLRAFIRQEAWHGRAHEDWNQVLISLGYDEMRAFDDQQKRLRQWANENLPAMTRLAITAGAEHMTASLARLLLYRRADLIDRAARPVRDLLVWHALEEVEHKSVCFDLYRCAGGRYRRRVMGLTFAFIDTVRLVRRRHRYLLEADGLWNWRTRRESWRKVWGPRGLIGQLVPELLRYLRPGFDPWDTDERRDIEARFAELAPS